MKFKSSDRFLVTCKVSAKVYKINPDKETKKLWKSKYDIDINKSIFEDTESETWVLVEDNIRHCSYYYDGKDSLKFDKKTSIIVLSHQFNCHRYDIHNIFDMESNFDFDKDFEYWLKSYMEYSDNEELSKYGESLELEVETFDISFDIKLHPNLEVYYKSVDRKESKDWDREIAAERIQKFYRFYKAHKLCKENI